MTETDVIQIAKALADPTRYAMLQDIRRAGRLTCSQVGERCSKSQPTVSHHLKILENAGLLLVEAEGVYHMLTVNEPRLAEFARRVSP